jgi:hypothetical protein
MLLRVRRDGFAVCRRACPHSPHYAALPLPLKAASAQPHGLNSSSPYPGILRPQLRILRTWTHTKGDPSQSRNGTQYPRLASLPLNWSSVAHRTRHIAAAMTTQTQSRGHAGHSHHHHHHDNTFLLSKNKNDAGVRITRIGLYVNLGMAVSKGFGGYVFNSQGMKSSVLPKHGKF